MLMEIMGVIQGKKFLLDVLMLIVVFFGLDLVAINETLHIISASAVLVTVVVRLVNALRTFFKNSNR
jgi:hypothetical protein